VISRLRKSLYILTTRFMRSMTSEVRSSGGFGVRRLEGDGLVLDLRLAFGEFLFQGIPRE
jgi:hypothetical protein